MKGEVPEYLYACFDKKTGRIWKGGRKIFYLNPTAIKLAMNSAGSSCQKERFNDDEYIIKKFKLVEVEE